MKCPMCGAAAADDATACSFCNARLATVACPSCFGMMFIGCKFCSHCGAEFHSKDDDAGRIVSCPRCHADMKHVRVGAAGLSECPQCGGIWVEVSEFEKICASHEQQAAVLGAASIEPAHPVDLSHQPPVRYVPCPTCKQLMNRINFARCSGVIVDVCKGHGTWFDRDELREIVEFIRHGGLDNAREREKAKLEEERRALNRQQMTASQGVIATSFDPVEHHSGSLSAARGLLEFLLD